MVWPLSHTTAILAGSPSLPGGFRAVARYHFAENTSVCDQTIPRSWPL